MISDISKISSHLTVETTSEVPWFPRSLSDLNLMGKILSEEDGIQMVDHPGFHDQDYKDRRAFII